MQSLPVVARLGEILLRQNKISRDQLNEALANHPKPLNDLLLERGWISDEDLAMATADLLNLDYCTPGDLKIDQNVLSILTPHQAQTAKAIPLERGENWVRIATATPDDLFTLDRLRRELGITIRWSVTTPMQIEKALERYYRGKLNSVDTILQDLSEQDVHRLESSSTMEITDLSVIEDLANEAPIIRMVNLIITEGVRLGASDIHIEPYEKYVKLRYRIDGILYARDAPPLNLYPAVISRIKLTAGMDITEKRLPQDGRIRLRLNERDLDLRVAVAPTLHGEAVVMRILNRQNLLLDLEELGFSPETLQDFNRLIQIPYGMVLVTGPTGSGKTTTLYAALSKLNQTQRKIITIEDPVEYELPGVNQMQVNPKIDWSFAQGIRTIVRHDPDIILVGEIRDRETAEMAIQSALTGHLVFSTLHTNDSASAFTRLTDMGIEPFLIASTVRGVLAQRLVRRNCPHCLRSYQPTAHEAKLLKEEYGSIFPLVSGQGCDQCSEIGYRGQVGLYELLVTNERIARLVMEHVPASHIREVAGEYGMKTLRQDGWLKAASGLTTVAEVLRVTFD
ncbi:MAG TPA: ATPase, T2SS/T4P/T4SS family [Bacillota bacterium]|nr:ATPase, T2SS/T4P/T4SS family [Bacillota bacterium]